MVFRSTSSRSTLTRGAPAPRGEDVLMDKRRDGAIVLPSRYHRVPGVGNPPGWDAHSRLSASWSGLARSEGETLPPHFSPDGRYLYFGTPFSWKWSLWDLANRCVIRAPGDNVHFGGFTPSGEAVVFDDDGSVHWWDPSTGQSRTPSSRRVRQILRRPTGWPYSASLILLYRTIDRPQPVLP